MPPSPPESLPELLSRYAAGGGEAVFAELVRLGAPLVWSVAMRRLGDAQMAEEAAQNVFIILARKARILAARPGLSAWLHHTALLEAANLARSRTRREHRLRRMAFDPVASTFTASVSGAGPATGDMADEGGGAAEAGAGNLSGSPADGAWLDEALNRLPPADRALLLGRFYEKRGFRELAVELGKSEPALRKQTERALAKLRARLRRRSPEVLPAPAMGTLLETGGFPALTAGLASGAATGSGMAGFSPPLAAGWAAKAVAAAGSAPAAAAPAAGLVSKWSFLIASMSTPKTTLSAAVLLFLLLGTSAWLQLENSAQAGEVSRLSRSLAAAPAFRKKPPGIPGGGPSSDPQAAASATAGLPPVPLTGAALVKAWQRSQGNALYDPGYTLQSIAPIWESIPEADWPHLLQEVDQANATALARRQTAAELINGWKRLNPRWACGEFLKRKMPELAYGIRNWASTDRESAWQWIQEKTASGELPVKGSGGTPGAAPAALRDFADALIGMEDVPLREFVSKQEDAGSRSMLLQELSAAFLAQGYVEKNLTLLAQAMPSAEVAETLAATAGNIVDERSVPGTVENFLKLLRHPDFPAGQQQRVLTEALSHVEAEPGTQEAALAVMAAVSLPEMRESNLVWLAEMFAGKNPPPAAGSGGQNAARRSAGQAETDTALAATAGALARSGNADLAAYYVNRIRDGGIRAAAAAGSVSTASETSQP